MESEQYPYPFKVDYAKDTITLDLRDESYTREVNMDRYKSWLRWCDDNFVKLDISGGRRNYTEYSWHLLSMFEDKVDELRSGAEIWYTAPEEPAETL